MTEITQIRNQKFRNVTSKLQQLVDDEKTGGILILVQSKGRIVYADKFGWKDKEQKRSIEFDDVFRIYSMTKPIVTVATLLLMEEGLMELDDPIEKYLPELKEKKVLTSVDRENETYDLVNQNNSITLRHLFTHTSGFSYGMNPGFLEDRIYGQILGINHKSPLTIANSMHEKYLQLSSEQFIQMIKEVPLIFEPGSKRLYGYNFEILGCIVEKATGKSLDEYLKDKILRKLSMKDTDFYIPSENKQRIVKIYTHDKNQKLIECSGSVTEEITQKPKFFSAGTGLCSTLRDYLVFCRMLLNHGIHENQQIIPEHFIDLMTQNHLTDHKTLLEMFYIPITDEEFINYYKGYGFGLGVELKVANCNTAEAIGSYHWGGIATTIFWIDPQNEIIGILLTQVLPPDNWVRHVDRDEIKSLVYESSALLPLISPSFLIFCFCVPINLLTIPRRNLPHVRKISNHCMSIETKNTNKLLVN